MEQPQLNHAAVIAAVVEAWQADAELVPGLTIDGRTVSPAEAINRMTPGMRKVTLSRIGYSALGHRELFGLE